MEFLRIAIIRILMRRHQKNFNDGVLLHFRENWENYVSLELIFRWKKFKDGTTFRRFILVEGY